MVDTTAAQPPERRERERAAVADAEGGALHDAPDKELGVGQTGRGTPGGAPEAAGSPRRQAEQADASAQVRESGLDPDAVEEQSGYSARETPTNEPGSEERSSYPDADPRKEDQAPDQPADERDDSRLLVDREDAPEGIADAPTTAEMGSAKTQPMAPGTPREYRDGDRFPGEQAPDAAPTSGEKPDQERERQDG
jgi:hypothetical protein